jgi:hypothetical protein
MSVLSPIDGAQQQGDINVSKSDTTQRLIREDIIRGSGDLRYLVAMASSRTAPPTRLTSRHCSLARHSACSAKAPATERVVAQALR